VEELHEQVERAMNDNLVLQQQVNELSQQIAQLEAELELEKTKAVQYLRDTEIAEKVAEDQNEVIQQLQRKLRELQLQQQSKAGESSSSTRQKRRSQTDGKLPTESGKATWFARLTGNHS
jgi:chromosome segregation ATPase